MQRRQIITGLGAAALVGARGPGHALGLAQDEEAGAGAGLAKDLAKPGGSGAASALRPMAWAQPLQIDGVPNLHRLTPRLYRSAQPTAEGFGALAAMGLRSVLNLRRFSDDRPLLVGTPITAYQVKIKTRDIDQDDGAHLLAALKIIRDARGPLLVHCIHGSDRTGLVLALWRILVQGWSRQEALVELRDGGYGFHHVWINIPHYLETVDLDRLKARLAKA